MPLHIFNITSKKIPIANDISVKMQFAHPFFAAIFSHCVPFPLPGPPEVRAMNYFGPVVSDPVWVFNPDRIGLANSYSDPGSVDITCPDPEFELDLEFFPKCKFVKKLVVLISQLA